MILTQITGITKLHPILSNCVLPSKAVDWILKSSQPPLSRRRKKIQVVPVATGHLELLHGTCNPLSGFMTSGVAFLSLSSATPLTRRRPTKLRSSFVFRSADKEKPAEPSPCFCRHFSEMREHSASEDLSGTTIFHRRREGGSRVSLEIRRIARSND